MGGGGGSGSGSLEWMRWLDCAASVQAVHRGQSRRPDLSGHVCLGESTGDDGADSDAIMVLRFAAFQAWLWRAWALVEPSAGWRVLWNEALARAWAGLHGWAWTSRQADTHGSLK